MAAPVKLTIVYYSTYGTNYQMARTAAEAAEAAGAEVRLRRCRETAPREVVEGQAAWKASAEQQADVPEVSHDDMTWADAYLFSSPTRYGVAASQVRAFIDTLGPLWMQGKLAGKAASAMSSAQNPHGGQETTILGLHTTFCHFGCVIVPPGYTDPITYAAGGNPYGTSVTANGQPIPQAQLDAIAYQTRRLVEYAAKIRA